MKKILALVLALMLVLGMTAALADNTYSITITNAKKGETYNAYKVFDVSYTASGSYSYWIDSNSAFYDTVSAFAATASNGLTLQPVANTTRVNVIAGAAFTDAKAADLAVLLNNDASKPTAAGSVTPTADGSATINVTPDEPGYYFVDTALGSVCALQTSDPTAEITEKNTTTTTDKKVLEDGGSEQDDDLGDKNDADVGDTVNFTATVTIAPHQKNVVWHDIMQLDKLAFNWNSVTVTGADGHHTVYYAAHDSVVSTLPGDADYTGDTFAVAFDSAWTQGLTADTTVTITYSAVVTEGAIIGAQSGLAMDAGNDNKSSVTYGDSQRSTWDWTRTYVWSFDILKYTAGENDAKIPLAGAKFQLKKGDTVLTFDLISTGAAAVEADPENGVEAADATPTIYRYNPNGSVTTLETPASGLIKINGLDADTYSLVETDAPEGYNKLTAPIAVVLDSNTDTAQGDDNAHQADATITLKQDNVTVSRVEALNQTGSQLPSTGGIGTTLFYVGGGILVLLAVIFLVTKRRMNAND